MKICFKKVIITTAVITLIAICLIILMGMLQDLSRNSLAPSDSTDANNSLPSSSSLPSSPSLPSKPKYILGNSVVDSFANWSDPAIFYGYNTATQEEILIITDFPFYQEKSAPRIACLKVDFGGIQGFIHALCNSFSGIVLAYTEINIPDAMYLHNAALVGSGMGQEYHEGERIDLSNCGTNPSIVQYYLGYMRHGNPSDLDHELWNRLSSGSNIVLVGNMALEESAILKSHRDVYDRVLGKNELSNVLAILES